MLRLSHAFPSLIVLTALMASVALAQPAERDRGDRERPMSPVLTVNGEGKASATPDRATVRVGAVAQAKDASEAQAQVSAIVTKSIEAIKGLGIDAKAIQTSGVSLHPVYSHDRSAEEKDVPGRPHITSYAAQNGVTVRVDDLAKLGQVIDLAVANGGNSIDGVNFELKDDAPKRKEALKEAATEAKGKAEAIAEAMGLELLGVQEVVEGGVNVVYPMMGRGAMELSSADSSPIEAGQVETTASLTVTYRIREPGKGDADEVRMEERR